MSRTRIPFIAIACILIGVAAARLGFAQWRHFGDAGPAESTPVAAKPPGLDLALVREMVDAHNAERARVGTNPVQWSEPLAAIAREWAEGLIASGKFEHPFRPPYGVNLYEITGGSARPAEVVKDWAGEAQDYTYSTNTCAAVCGHYTQVIWNDTKEIGCGVARGGEREIWVCEYDPPGNFVGKKPY